MAALRKRAGSIKLHIGMRMQRQIQCYNQCAPIAPTRLDRGALLRDHLCALHDGTRLQAVQPPTHALLRHIGA